MPLSNFKFLARWNSAWHKKFNIPKGYILLKYNEVYRKNISKAMLDIDTKQKALYKKLTESGEKFEPEDVLRELEITFKYSFKKRTLDQNALMWSLYQIEATEQNGGMSGSIEHEILPMELYIADLHLYGEREIITTKKKNYGNYSEEYKIIESIKISDGSKLTVKDFLQREISDDEWISLKVINGSSKFNTVEMGKWIDRIFNRLCCNGVSVTNPGDIHDYWVKWRNYLNDNKLVIHDKVMTQAEYKELNPICEACGEPVFNGNGELSHIKAVGMGRDRTSEPTRNYASNWLHLCTSCHREIWHQKGEKTFIKMYPHLTYKVNSALHRDYKSLAAITQDDVPNLLGDNSDIVTEPKKSIGKKESSLGLENSENRMQNSLKSMHEISKEKEKPTREKIKKMYITKLIDKDEAIKHLKNLGASEEEISLITNENQMELF
jgi:hypothetical protein